MWNVLRKSALEQPAIAAIVVVVIIVERKKVTVRVLPFAISRSGSKKRKAVDEFSPAVVLIGDDEKRSGWTSSLVP